MKKHYLLAFTMLSLIFTSIAQTPCDAGRYSTDLFPNVTITSGITFGQNTDFIGGNQTLALDFYEPTGDTETARPLIVWAHGGSFIGGSRTDGDVVALSNAFAKKGYVCASIDYRVGMWPIDSVNAIKAVVRAVQDMKAAVRFFYQDRATTDTYKIDTTRIIIAGSSAGAITALHMAYLDKDCEIENYITPTTLNGMGGIEGLSGNQGYSSDIHAVVNLCGALASYGWLEAGDAPVCSLHGDNDNTVPYNHGVASVSGFNVISMDGSRMIDEQANTQGVQHNFFTHYGSDHAVYAAGGAFMDTTINFVSDFLVDFMGCSEPITQAENTPSGTATLYPLAYCGLNTESLLNDELIDKIFPNPSESLMTIEFRNEMNGGEISIYDPSGRIVKTYLVEGTSLNISKDDIGAGAFILRITNAEGAGTIKRIVFQ
jgi:poly(3-hydroxybutyrate) depolymerase